MVGPGRGAAARALGCVLGLGTTSWSLSELCYWSRFRASDDARGWVATWLAYCVVTYLALVVVRRLRVAGGPRLLLAGAVFGWLVEGCLSGTLFADLPVTIVWTAVAQHGLLTVVGGWWWLPLRLRERGMRHRLQIAALLGVGYGLWAVGWWGPASAFWDVPAVHPELANFAEFTAIIVCATGVGYAVQAHVTPAAAALRGGWLAICLATLLGAWYVVRVGIAVPWSAPLLIALLLLAGWALRRSRPTADAADLIDGPLGVPVARLWPLALAGGLAIGVYAAAMPLDGTRAPRILHAVAPAVLGLVSIVAFVRGCRRPESDARTQIAEPSAREPLRDPPHRRD